ncbi:MAG: transposase [Actinomycetota bacterium]|nr:transposase [Actinomycetota bacterium]
MPRIKRINRVKLYDRAAPDAYPALGPAMTRPIRWEVFEENCSRRRSTEGWVWQVGRRWTVQPANRERSPWA